MTAATTRSNAGAMRAGLDRAEPGPRWLGLSVLLLAAFVTIFDLFVVNVAIPSMRAELGANLSQTAFIVAGYELAFGVLLVTGGRLGDLYGRRRLFVAGMVGFTLASTLCGLAPNVYVLIGARVLQGLTAALLFPQVYASIRAGFSEADSRRAFGYLGMTLGLAAIAGQILGGWIVEANLFGLGWRAIFLVNVPVGVVAIILARFIPESRTDARSALDWLGVALVSAGLTLLLAPIVEAPTRGWTGSSCIALTAGVGFLALFWFQQEARRRSGGVPLVDMRLLADPRFARGGVLILLIFSAAASFFLSFALFVQTGLGLSPFTAGSLFVPCSIGFIAASLAAPRLVARFGTAIVAWTALVYAAALVALVAQVWSADAHLVAARLIPVLIVIGAAQGVIHTQILDVILGFVAERQAGMAAGVVSTLQQVAAALGVATVGISFGMIVDQVAPPASARAAIYASAFAVAMLYNFVVVALAAALLRTLTHRRIRGVNRPPSSKAASGRDRRVCGLE